MSFLTPQDFDSDSILCMASTRLTEDRIQTFIDAVEKRYLQDLLGCDLYDLFIADLVSNVPQTQRFIDIFDEFCKDDNCGIIRSEGIKEMLKGFTYWEWEKQNKAKNTQTGSIVNENEVSREATFDEAGLYEVYNNAIKTYKAIQWFICDDLTTYPEYNGQRKEITHWF